MKDIEVGMKVVNLSENAGKTVNVNGRELYIWKCATITNIGTLSTGKKWYEVKDEKDTISTIDDDDFQNKSVALG